MKASALKLPIFGLVAALSSGGCASTMRIADPVGPDPRVAAVAGDDGQLIVYTRVELAQTQEMPDTEVARHLPYVVLDAQGHQVTEVDNHAFPESGPMTVNLHPGTYIIRAPGLSGRTDVELVARVDAGKSTIVHLDSPLTRPDELAGEGLFAKAPTGWRVGWNARAGSILGTEAELRYVGSPVVEGFVAEAHPASGATVSVDERVQSPLDELRLGTADLAGVAGSFPVPAEATCHQVGSDHLVAVVRNDSPLKALDASQLQAIGNGSIRRWSGLGGDDSAVVLLAGRGTGADAAVTTGHATWLFPEELVRRVANANDVIAITSQASVRGAKGVRVVEITGAPASATIPLSLCAAKRSTKAAAFVRWSASDEARTIAARYFEPATTASAMADGSTSQHGG